MLSRRGLLGGLFGSTVRPEVLATSDSKPDTDLLDLCRQLAVLASELDRVIKLRSGSDPGYQLIQQVLKGLGNVEANILNSSARSLPGLVAKARIVNWCRDENLDVNADARLSDQISLSIVKDLLALDDQLE